MNEVEKIVNNYHTEQANYLHFLNEIEMNNNKLNHVKNINDINTILFNTSVDIERINPTAFDLHKNVCIIDNCKKLVCYQLKYNNSSKFICWHHLCNLIQNYNN